MITRAAAAAALCLSCSLAGAALAQDGLKTIRGPGGGKIVYGEVMGESTDAGAMGAVLRSVHAQCGDRPEVGQLFQLRGTHSVAAFFTATKHTQGDAKLAGMVIVADVAPGHPEAALLTDDAERFGTSINPMLKSLFAVWHPGGGGNGGPGASGRHGSGRVMAMHPVSLPDGSATASLPDGWTMSPQSGGGTIIAEGTNGESVLLGYPLLAMNANDPRVQQTMRFAQGAGRNTSYARALYYPYGAGAARTFVDLFQMTRQRSGLQPASFQLADVSPLPSRGMEQCAHLTGRVDAQDGKGQKEFNTVFCTGPLSPMGQYMNLAYHTAVPVAYADKERATIGAILASFNVNEAVVAREAGALAAPAIAAIHEIGRQVEARIATTHAEEDAQEASVERHWDSEDRNAQGFSNYLLDQSVIQDNENSAHGTVWNNEAAALVKSDPQRFQYVDTPDYWKGVDY